MKMGAYRADRKSEGKGDLLVAAFFLMIKDKDRALTQAELPEMVVNEAGELFGFKLVDGAAFWMLEPLFPGWFVAEARGGEGDVAAIFALQPLPFVLGDIHDDAVKIGADQSLATKVGESAVEPQEDLLGEIFKRVAAAHQASECAEDHRLVFVDDLLEGGFG